MEPRFQAAYKHMKELENGAIANPEEGRMVGHYWLRKPELAPTRFLKAKIDPLDALCQFADDVVSGKVMIGSLSQVLHVEITCLECSREQDQLSMQTIASP